MEAGKATGDIKHLSDQHSEAAFPRRPLPFCRRRQAVTCKQLIFRENFSRAAEFHTAAGVEPHMQFDVFSNSTCNFPIFKSGLRYGNEFGIRVPANFGNWFGAGMQLNHLRRDVSGA
jgi:hypothetical protein